ncbi:galactokinase [Streptacidiphilus jiangxiensis]|uniref:Galactokinase n=1 Tax=Streptacidiphilus jiangxiensis TaxID=235985 RepID=A0A1H7FFF8_STRJI|nr:galactokinase [Streptacidiphilus jiangxiensis]SEK24007.1 galactokinase [Streptacidiphilus jiangxiensis]
MNESHDAAVSVAEEFTALYGREPEGVWQAPGRINLIGEHTDYNDGFVLPVALPHAARVAVSRRDDGRVRVHSSQGDGTVVEFTLDSLVPGSVAGWAAYPAGALWVLREEGHPVPGIDLHLDSDVPFGAGLSSSAALQCAVLLACDELLGLGIERPRLARLAQRAENDYVGAPVGVMDQTASLCCAEGAALFLDTRDMSQRQVPLDLAADGLVLLVVDTRVEHGHADGAYRHRRAGCERSADLLGVKALRDVEATGGPELEALLARLPEEELRSLTRHVVTENARVLQAERLLATGELRALGPVLTAGHASQRDDFAISCPQSDTAVDTAIAHGALGARQTGGGFGGCVIVLTEPARVPGISAAIEAAYAAQDGWNAPAFFTATPAPGALRLR